MTAMSSSRPYLLQAIYDWIVDNNCTPYLLVDATCEGAAVPVQYVKDGQIVLNISPTAVIQLHMDKEAVSFNARFSGTPMDVYVPISGVMGIYARENGQGMLFEPEDVPPPPSSPEGDEGAGKSAAKSGKPALRVVK